MCSRHQPIAGADSEPVHPTDTFCDQCAKTVYVGRLYAYQGKWLCAACAVRLSGDPVPEEASFAEWKDWLGWNLS